MWVLGVPPVLPPSLSVLSASVVVVPTVPPVVLSSGELPHPARSAPSIVAPHRSTATLVRRFVSGPVSPLTFPPPACQRVLLPGRRRRRRSGVRLHPRSSRRPKGSLASRLSS